MVSYLVDWKNGFVGGYTKDFEQMFCVPRQEVFDSMVFYGIGDLKIITRQELDELRGFHLPTLEEYLTTNNQED